MAIYRFKADPICRSDGRSAVASAAYRAGNDLYDEKYGKSHDYSRKRGVVHSEIMAPENTPDWMKDRGKLWNAVEAVEKRKDAQLARELQITLPRELDKDEQREVIRSFIRDEFVQHGMIADIAIHNPKASDGLDQPHAHVMLTMRELTGEGFGKKNRDWNRKDHLERWREKWQDYANDALERAGHSARIDHRSLEAQRQAANDRGDEERAAELDREPQPKLGSAAAALERRGIATERGDELRAVVARNAERQSLRDQLREIGQRIGDTLSQVRDGLRNTADTIRDRLSQAAAVVMDRGRGSVERQAEGPKAEIAGERTTDSIRERLSRAAASIKERDDMQEKDTGSTAERLSQRLEKDDSSDRGGADRPRENSTEDRIAERLRDHLGGKEMDKDMEEHVRRIEVDLSRGIER
ncbi:MobQ family relaxase (plasmid) [Agrobacterium leguminum]|uniref:MobQ family relaxase n=1 Tax=Agrobacterium leguminum TaxID=2792015 RepID=UPI00148525AE|nr:MobQ family relaxase [Agrobacterium leguminum]WFS69603.1 MobQ family relaxase [Agrobacterium leguminum]